MQPKRNSVWKLVLRISILLSLASSAAVAGTFRFPHYGDGAGLSMLFSVSNLGSERARGTMKFYGTSGNPQQLPLSSGPASEVLLDLAPNSSHVVRTDGSSAGVLSGFVEVTLDQEELSGLAIFQFSSGLEASVLPVEPSRRFTLFVESSPALDTGIAVARDGDKPVRLQLYALDGSLLRELSWEFEGRQRASFLQEIFEGLGDTQGLLVMDSEEAFTTVGLRFGGGILSTIPVVPGRVIDRLHGLDFSPYINSDPTRGAVISEEDLRDRMEIIADYTRWIRTYGTAGGLEDAGRVAHELGLRAAIGAWIDGDMASNRSQIDKLIEMGQAGEVDLAVVGSETLLRGDVTGAQLADYMREVKVALPGIPVTTADVWDQLIANPEVIQESDLIFANMYPYFSGIGVIDAVAVLEQWFAQLQQAAGEKKIIISETGWPSCGQAVGSAVASMENSAFYFLSFVSWARANQVEHFYFEALDEPWKEQFEGELGRCWGLWDVTGTLKPGMRDVFDGKTIGGTP